MGKKAEQILKTQVFKTCLSVHLVREGSDHVGINVRRDSFKNNEFSKSTLAWMVPRRFLVSKTPTLVLLKRPLAARSV